MKAFEGALICFMKNVCLIDGGLGQELYRRSGSAADPLWSVKVMQDQPELVEAVHRDFIEAGAEVLTLNTYAATPERLIRDGDLSWLEPLHTQALALADAARKKSVCPRGPVRLAGCLPPLIGSYSQEATPDNETCKKHFQRMVRAQSQADLFICETMSSIREGILAAEAGLEGGKPVLLSFTVSDGTGAPMLRSGESIERMVESVRHLPLAGLLLNCSTPEAISRALPQLKAGNLPFGAYANGFTSVAPLKPGGTVDALQMRHDLGPQAYADWAMRWVDMGASFIGGCCEVGPAHIRVLGERLSLFA